MYILKQYHIEFMNFMWMLQGCANRAMFAHCYRHTIATNYDDDVLPSAFNSSFFFVNKHDVRCSRIRDAHFRLHHVTENTHERIDNAYTDRYWNIPGTSPTQHTTHTRHTHHTIARELPRLNHRKSQQKQHTTNVICLRINK